MSENIYKKYCQWCDSLERGAVYRGHSDDSWKISSSLYRRREKDVHFHATISEIILSLSQYAQACYASEKHTEFPATRGYFDILSHLQHYGSETCLIDFTYNRYVALFFACSEKFNKNAKVISVNINHSDMLLLSDKSLESINLRDLYLPLGPKLYYFKRINNSTDRMLNQKSIFITGKSIIRGDYTNIEEFIIPSKSKKSIMKILKDKHKIDKHFVYPDEGDYKETVSKYSWIARERMKQTLESRIDLESSTDIRNCLRRCIGVLLVSDKKYKEAFEFFDSVEWSNRSPLSSVIFIQGKLDATEALIDMNNCESLLEAERRCRDIIQQIRELNVESSEINLGKVYMRMALAYLGLYNFETVKIPDNILLSESLKYSQIGIEKCSNNEDLASMYFTYSQILYNRELFFYTFEETWEALTKSKDLAIRNNFNGCNDSLLRDIEKFKKFLENQK